jgi:hypothetical protein
MSRMTQLTTKLGLNYSISSWLKSIIVSVPEYETGHSLDQRRSRCEARHARQPANIGERCADMPWLHAILANSANWSDMSQVRIGKSTASYAGVGSISSGSSPSASASTTTPATSASFSRNWAFPT